MFEKLFRLFRRRPSVETVISKAVVEHSAFEAEHIAHLEALAQAEIKRGRNLFFAVESQRTVSIEDDQSRMRRLGEYDPDQRVERIAGEVIRTYHQQGFSAPKNLRELVEEALA